MVKAATYEKQKQVQEKGFENYRLFSMRLENE